MERLRKAMFPKKESPRFKRLFWILVTDSKTGKRSAEFFETFEEVFHREGAYRYLDKGGEWGITTGVVTSKKQLEEFRKEYGLLED